MSRSNKRGSAPVVLIVDDDADTREMYSTYLTSQGVRVLLAGDGFTATRVATSLHPDVIVMDLSLPRVDGWEATRRLKADRKTAHIPIIALTGRVSGGSAEWAIDAGCDAYVLKPCLPDHLLKEIRTQLARSSQRSA
jgi:two-component system, cell cycle response regulator DivK